VAHGEAEGPRAQRPELAQILREHATEIPYLNKDQARVVSALTVCRTAALGGHLQRCDHCGRESPLYNSCRNRHCPKCQSLDQALWVEAQARDLLPVPYFHEVFTLPHGLNPLFLRDPGVAFTLLFEAAARTVIEVCRYNLGAIPGLIAVLHTWTQTLDYHPHIHCIVSGGGLSEDGQRWIASRPNFFLPVRKLSQVFRGKLLEAFELALAQRRLRTPEGAGRLLLRRAAAQNFVVYSKPPMAGPEQVLRYLGRYTHRIALSNDRLLAHHDGQVTFSYKDRKHGGRRRHTTLPGAEFTRRFLLHVIPRRFVRVRHYGLLANGVKVHRLACARLLLGSPALGSPAPPELSKPHHESWQDTYRRLVGKDPLLCPACHFGRLVVVAEIPPSVSRPRNTSQSRSP
jgi:Putative transposase/Transposase zinc-binding domain